MVFFFFAFFLHVFVPSVNVFYHTESSRNPLILFIRSKNLRFLIAFTRASLFLSLPISFCAPHRPLSRKGLSGSSGVLNHPLLPKESSTRFATNDPTLPDVIEEVLAKQKTANGLNGKASRAINSPKELVCWKCVCNAFTPREYNFLVELVFQGGYYIVNLRYLLSAAGQTDLLLLLFTTILLTAIIYLFFMSNGKLECTL